MSFDNIRSTEKKSYTLTVFRISDTRIKKIRVCFDTKYPAGSAGFYKTAVVAARLQHSTKGEYKVLRSGEAIHLALVSRVIQGRRRRHLKVLYISGKKKGSRLNRFTAVSRAKSLDLQRGIRANNYLFERHLKEVS